VERNKPYTYNERYRVIQGGEYFTAGQIVFPSSEDNKPDGTYRTVFGPSVNHSGVIYRNNDHNLLSGVKYRLMSCRQVPADVSLSPLQWDRHLEDLQAVSVALHRESFVVIGQLYAEVYSDYTTAMEECVDHHDDPHQKKELRVLAFKELCTELGFPRIWAWRNEVTIKFKKDEYAKYGKPGRCIVDLGVGMSLQGFRITKFMKTAMTTHPFTSPAGTAEFCSKPDHDALVSAFERLMSPAKSWYFVYFSDDSCFSVRTSKGVFMYNLDISACDASHRKIFDLLYALTPEQLHDDVRVLLEQLSLPMRVRSKSGRYSVLLKAVGPILFSGSTLTTVLNNIAEMLIAHELSSCDWELDVPGNIISAFRRAGYLVTLDACATYHHLQFLKHSPCYDHAGFLRPVLNPGVLLRASGTCRGDLPGTGDLELRGLQFQKGLLLGAYPSTRFSLLTAMYAALTNISITTSVTMAVKKVFEYTVAQVSDEEFSISDEEIYQRYALDGCEIDELLSCMASAGFATSVSITALDKILAKDYGLGIVWEPTEPDYNNPNLPVSIVAGK
jgi:hypothetical protein